MTTLHRIKMTGLALAAAATLAACSSLPADNPSLLNARQAYEAAQNDPQSRDLAATELAAAGVALNRANDAFRRGDKTAEVDHLAYLVGQQVAVAQRVGRQKAAEAALAGAEAERDRARLAARTSEADMAQRNAQVAQQDAQRSQADADASRRQSQAAQQSALASRAQADASRAQADASQLQTDSAKARARQLEDQLRDLNAKQTDRGMVVTIGDVLFDSGRAELKSGSERNMDKLVGFFKAYPQRKALVEGFTDSQGGNSSNQDLSSRRAEAVRSALVGMGVARERIDTRGYGEAYPVAGNDSASGRQLNRRVEIVLSDDSGRITAR
jgi:outer membrane protein OmpA-like peptidoglycan-associated protein